MSLGAILILVLVVGICLAYFRVAEPFRTIAIVICIILVAWWAIEAFGLFDSTQPHYHLFRR